MVGPSRKANTSMPPIFNEVRSAMEIANFIWRLEAYFSAMSIEENAQKVSNTSLFLKEIAFVCWCHKCDDVKRGYDPIDT